MYVLTINHKKITLAAVIITVAFILIILKLIRREKPETGEPPLQTPEGNYRYSGTGRPSTKNFVATEFDCHDGTGIPQQFYGNVQFLMENLEVLRAALGVPIHINSGYRTNAYNARLNGSATNSQHLAGKAADITAIGYTARTIHAKILQLIASGKMHNGGVGLYKGFVHYDVRSRPGRWDMT